MLQKETIEYNGKYACFIEEVFLIREKILSKIPKYFHVFYCQHFVGVKFDMLSKRQFYFKYKLNIFLGILGFENETSKLAEI